MTQEYDPAYLDKLVVVAADDVAVLRAKEATYRGSWKRRGGVGAFMMLARNWDRIENFMRRRQDQYNLFGEIEAAPDGHDGTCLACVRDLRRYLMLVEAEMMHCGLVQPEMLPPAPPVATVGLATVKQARFRPMPTDPGEPAGGSQVGQVPFGGVTNTQISELAMAWGCTGADAFERLLCIAGTRYNPIKILQGKWGKDEAGVLDELKKSRREDSNRHALQDHGEIVKKTPPDPRQFDSSDRYQDGLPREEYVRTGTPYVYDTRSGTAVVDRGAAKNDCGHLPRLSIELNHKEWTEMPSWYQWMYWWSGEKHVLEDTYRADWGRQ